MVNNVQAVAGAYAVSQSRSVRRSGSQEVIQPKDEIVISKEGQSFSSMLKKLKGEEPVRQDKVDYYTEAIKNGTYSVSSTDIAGKMLTWL